MQYRNKVAGYVWSYIELIEMVYPFPVKFVVTKKNSCKGLVQTFVSAENWN